MDLRCKVEASMTGIALIAGARHCPGHLRLRNCEFPTNGRPAHNNQFTLAAFGRLPGRR